MNWRATLISLILALSLGGYWYVHEYKGGPKREQAELKSKLVFPDLASSSQTSEMIISVLNRPELALKKQGAQWQLLKPLQAPCDDMQVQQIVDALAELKNEGTVAEKDANLHEFGLDQPTGTYSFKDLSGTTRTVMFGRDNPSQQYSYCRVDGKTQVFMVSGTLKNQILKDIGSLRDKTIWAFDPDKVIRIRSNFGKGMTLEKGPKDEWKILRPQRAQGRKYEVRQWLEQLKDLKIQDFVKEKGANPAAYGLDDGHRLELAFAKAPKSMTLIQGFKLKGGKAHYYKVAGRPLIFSLPDWADSTVAKDVAGFVSPTAQKK